MGCWDTFTLLLTHPSGMVRSTVFSGFLFLLLSTSISVGKCLSNFISKMRKIYLLANFWWIKYEYTAWASQIALVVKNLPANTGDVRALGQEDPSEKGMATHSGILPWRIPWMEGPGGLQSTGSQRVGHDWSNLAHKHSQIESTRYVVGIQ